MGAGIQVGWDKSMEKLQRDVNNSIAMMARDVPVGPTFNGPRAPSAAAATTSPIQQTISISVNGIKQLDEIVKWYQSREFLARVHGNGVM